MRKTEKREIDGVLFEVQQLGFHDGRRLFLRLSKALGPGLAAAAAGAKTIADLALVHAVEKILDGVDDEDVDAFLDAMAPVVRYSIDGGKKWPFLRTQDADDLFAGRMFVRFMPFARFALEVQYGDFFALLAKRLADADQQDPATPQT
jgi:hypothetical protein